MAKAGRGSDQFPLRLPDGLRDRIKAAAERNGRSMNVEIVRVLEREFPEPFPLHDRIDQLGTLFSAMLKVQGLERAMDVMSEELQEAAEAIVWDKVPEVPDREREAVSDLLNLLQTKIAAAKRERRRFQEDDGGVNE